MSFNCPARLRPGHTASNEPEGSLRVRHLAGIAEHPRDVRSLKSALLCLQLNFCRYGGEYVVRRQGPTDAFELKLTNWLDAYCILDRHQNPRANQDLSGLRFIAKPRRDIGHCSNGGIIETPLIANGTERRKSVRDTDAKAKLMSQPTPFLSQCPQSPCAFQARSARRAGLNLGQE